MAGTFEIKQAQRGEYTFCLRSRQGDVVAIGPSFPTREAAKRGIAAVLQAAAGATIEPEAALARRASKPPL